jgi:hypothetical protein
MRQKVIGGAFLLLPLLVAASGDAGTIFRLDTPQEDATVFGLVQVTGFILDDGEECGPQWTWNNCQFGSASVTAVDLYIDDELVASADLDQPRYDVLLAYPWYAGTAYERPGFATSFDSRALENGSHVLFVRVTFSDMTADDYGTRMFVVDNDINQAPIGELELPGLNQPMNGVFPVTGWALDDGEVRLVEVLVDGLAVGQANLGVHRPDIAHRFPSRPDADRAGFVRMLNTTVLPNGVHSLAVRLTDEQGASRVIGRRFVQTFNTGYNLPPFGGIDYPPANHVMFAKGCARPLDISTPPYEDVQVVEPVSGWALDVGSRTDQGGVAYVQLLIDGVIITDTYPPHPFHFSTLDTDVNTYGLERLDIQHLFPDVPNSKDAGFMFLLDASQLHSTGPGGFGFGQGLHYLKIRAGDLENNVADIAQIPFILDCDDDPDRPAFGDIYTPANMEQVAGVVEVTGWAIDPDTAEEVQIWVDGTMIGSSEIGLSTPEVTAMFPWLPLYYTQHAGFSFDLDTEAEAISDGPHVLVVRSLDYFGGETVVGERHFVVDN